MLFNFVQKKLTAEGDNYVHGRTWLPDLGLFGWCVMPSYYFTNKGGVWGKVVGRDVNLAGFPSRSLEFCLSILGVQFCLQFSNVIGAAKAHGYKLPKR